MAYGFIVAALYLDLGKIRKERNKLQEQIMAMNTKSGKAEKGGLFSRSTRKAVEAADSVVEKQQASKANK